MKGMGQALTLGISIASCFLAGFLLGYWMDQFFKTKPFFMIVGILSGVIAAFITLFKMVEGSKDGNH